MTQMMQFARIGKVVLPVGLLLITGCETTSSKQTKTAMIDTHDRVMRLDTNLNQSVTKLSQTTTDLMTRVDTSDAQNKELMSAVEDSQKKIDAMQGDLSDVKTRIYHHYNLSVAPGASISPPPPASVTPPPAPGNTTILPPPAAQVLPERTPVPVDPNQLPPVPPVAMNMPQTTLPPPPTTNVAPPVVAVPPQTTTSPPPPPVSTAPAAASADAEADYQRAQTTYAANDFTGALQQFDQFLQRYPTSEQAANAQFWKAKSYLNLGQYQEAIQEFTKVKSNYPTSTKVPFAMHNQAVAYSRLGQTAQAEKLMQDVIDNYPLSAAAGQAKTDLVKLKGR